MQPVIELKNLSVQFGRREILKELHTALFGRTVGLLGPNGVGKSTLIHALLGFCPVSSGTASIFGNDINGGPAGVPGQQHWQSGDFYAVGARGFRRSGAET